VSACMAAAAACAQVLLCCRARSFSELGLGLASSEYYSCVTELA
jgi:hypothetical protein